MSFVDGTLAKIDFDFKIRGVKIDKLFFLVHGMYPLLSHFVKTISIHITFVVSKLSKWQESVWKNFDHGFGVITKNSNFCNPQYAWTRG